MPSRNPPGPPGPPGPAGPPGPPAPAQIRLLYTDSDTGGTHLTLSPFRMDVHASLFFDGSIFLSWYTEDMLPPCDVLIGLKSGPMYQKTVIDPLAIDTCGNVKLNDSKLTTPISQLDIFSEKLQSSELPESDKPVEGNYQGFKEGSASSPTPGAGDFPDSPVHTAFTSPLPPSGRTQDEDSTPSMPPVSKIPEQLINEAIPPSLVPISSPSSIKLGLPSSPLPFSIALSPLDNEYPDTVDDGTFTKKKPRVPYYQEDVWEGAHEPAPGPWYAQELRTGSDLMPNMSGRGDEDLYTKPPGDINGVDTPLGAEAGKGSTFQAGTPPPTVQDVVGMKDPEGAHDVHPSLAPSQDASTTGKEKVPGTLPSSSTEEEQGAISPSSGLMSLPGEQLVNVTEEKVSKPDPAPFRDGLQDAELDAKTEKPIADKAPKIGIDEFSDFGSPASGPEGAENPSKILQPYTPSTNLSLSVPSEMVEDLSPGRPANLSGLLDRPEISPRDENVNMPTSTPIGEIKGLPGQDIDSKTSKDAIGSLSSPTSSTEKNADDGEIPPSDTSADTTRAIPDSRSHAAAAENAQIKSGQQPQKPLPALNDNIGGSPGQKGVDTVTEYSASLTPVPLPEDKPLEYSSKDRDAGHEVPSAISPDDEDFSTAKTNHTKSPIAEPSKTSTSSDGDAAHKDVPHVIDRVEEKLHPVDEETGSTLYSMPPTTGETSTVKAPDQESSLARDEDTLREQLPFGEDGSTSSLAPEQGPVYQPLVEDSDQDGASEWPQPSENLFPSVPTGQAAPQKERPARKSDSAQIRQPTMPSDIGAPGSKDSDKTLPSLESDTNQHEKPKTIGPTEVSKTSDDALGIKDDAGANIQPSVSPTVDATPEGEDISVAQTPADKFTQKQQQQTQGLEGRVPEKDQQAQNSWLSSKKRESETDSSLGTTNEYGSPAREEIEPSESALSPDDGLDEQLAQRVFQPAQGSSSDESMVLKEVGDGQAMESPGLVSPDKQDIGEMRGPQNQGTAPVQQSEVDGSAPSADGVNKRDPSEENTQYVSSPGLSPPQEEVLEGAQQDGLVDAEPRGKSTGPANDERQTLRDVPQIDSAHKPTQALNGTEQYSVAQPESIIQDLEPEYAQDQQSAPLTYSKPEDEDRFDVVGMEPSGKDGTHSEQPTMGEESAPTVPDAVTGTEPFEIPAKQPKDLETDFAKNISLPGTRFQPIPPSLDPPPRTLPEDGVVDSPENAATYSADVKDFTREGPTKDSTQLEKQVTKVLELDLQEMFDDAEAVRDLDEDTYFYAIAPGESPEFFQRPSHLDSDTRLILPLHLPSPAHEYGGDLPLDGQEAYRHTESPRMDSANNTQQSAASLTEQLDQKVDQQPGEEAIHVPEEKLTNVKSDQVPIPSDDRSEDFLQPSIGTLGDESQAEELQTVEDGEERLENPNDPSIIPDIQEVPDDKVQVPKQQEPASSSIQDSEQPLKLANEASTVSDLDQQQPPTLVDEAPMGAAVDELDHPAKEGTKGSPEVPKQKVEMIEPLPLDSTVNDAQAPNEMTITEYGVHHPQEFPEETKEVIKLQDKDMESRSISDQPDDAVNTGDFKNGLDDAELAKNSGSTSDPPRTDSRDEIPDSQDSKESIIPPDKQTEPFEEQGPGKTVVHPLADAGMAPSALPKKDEEGAQLPAPPGTWSEGDFPPQIPEEINPDTRLRREAIDQSDSEASQGLPGDIAVALGPSDWESKQGEHC